MAFLDLARQDMGLRQGLVFVFLIVSFVFLIVRGLRIHRAFKYSVFISKRTEEQGCYKLVL